MKLVMSSLAASTATISPAMSLAKTAGALVFVLLLIVALAWLVRRLPLARPGSAPMQAETGLRLGARERLVIVRVDGRRLLLGVTPAGIRLLTELEREDFADMLEDAIRDEHEELVS